MGTEITWSAMFLLILVVEIRHWWSKDSLNGSLNDSFQALYGGYKVALLERERRGWASSQSRLMFLL